MIENVSFIVIARNEAFAVDKCLGSIASMPIEGCEVICVDSDSSDDTLEIMKRYIGRIHNLCIVQCSGFLNAAVARNAGLKYATKKCIFFVDGDVELCPEFISEALEKIDSGKAEAVTGKLTEICYTDAYSQVIRRCADRRNITEELQIYQTGGIFLTTRAMVERVGAFDERLHRNQDLDYTLRLSRYGRLIAIPVVMGTHHTLLYEHRAWDYIKKGYPMYFGILIRKNMDRPRVLLDLLRGNRGYIWGFAFYLLLLFLSFLALTNPVLTTKVLWVLPVLVILDLSWGKLRQKTLKSHLLSHYVYCPLALAGLVLQPRRGAPCRVVTIHRQEFSRTLMTLNGHR